MGAIILTISVLVQAGAMTQAVRLALCHRRTGWVFLAVANLLMLGRRGFSLVAFFSHQRPADPVAEFIALLISLLMAIGLTLLLRWLRTPDATPETAGAVQHSALRQLQRQSVLLGVMSLFGCAVLSYFAYTNSRDAVTSRLLKGSLDLAHMLETAIRTAPDQPAALVQLARLWRDAPSQYADNYLCVIGADGKLQLNTRQPDKVGMFVGATEIPAEGNSPRTVLELVSARAAWAGRNRNAEGYPQIAAYAFSSNLNALVAVHLPAASVDAEIRAAALPWSAGIALLFIVVLPLSFGLLYYVSVSSQRAAFEALSRQVQSEARFRAIVESEPECVKLLAADGSLLEMNPAGLRMIEAGTFAEVANQCVFPWVVEEHRAAFRELTEKVFCGESGKVEFQIVGLKGGRRWLETHAAPLRDEMGRVTALLGITRDVTARKQAEEALRESEERLRILTDNARVGLVLIDLERRYVFANAAYGEVLGLPLKDIVGHRVPEVLPEVYEEQIRPRLDRAFGGERTMYELHRATPTGGHDCVVKYDPIRVGGVVTRVAVVVVDVTERKRAEEHVQRLNRTYAVLSEINQLIVRERDPQKILVEGCQIAVDKGGFRMAWIGLADETRKVHEVTAHAGASERTLERLDEILNIPGGGCGCAFTDRALRTGTHAICSDIEHDPQAEPWRDAALRRDYQSMVSLPIKVAKKTIGTFNLYASETDFFDEDEMRLLDELAVDIGFALEVSRHEVERERVQVELRASEERFRQLAENIQEVFWMTDPEQKQMFYVSPAYENIWGRTCASLYASPHSWLEAIHPDDRERVAQAVSDKQTRGEYDETYRIERPDGTVRWIRDRAFPVRDAAGEVVRLVGTAEDITEQRQLEEQFRQSQKMEAIGQLAGGVAHDFNNILAAILGNTELALADTAPDHPARESLDEIKSAAGRAKGLVQQILAFSRQQPQERRVIALDPLIKETIRLLRATVPANVEFAEGSEANVPNVLADATQMHQLLVNLCTNAWHALEGEQGRIEIKSQAVEIDSDAAGRITGLRPGRFVCLSVSDSGKGMDAATIKRIFDPFFTTKDPDKGTGLGLSVVHGIIQEHDGAIAVTSQPGKGTTFQIYLPAVDAIADTAVPTVRPPHRGQGQHILYLDDEESLVVLATKSLERLGYRISPFTRATDALKAFRENPGQFDLVITDLNMPGTSGLDVANELLKLRPDMPIAISSGHVTEELRQRAQDAGIRDVLYKPNTIGELSDAIHSLMVSTRQP